jgi:hypothetical protein
VLGLGLGLSRVRVRVLSRASVVGVNDNGKEWQSSGLLVINHLKFEYIPLHLSVIAYIV